MKKTNIFLIAVFITVAVVSQLMKSSDQVVGKIDPVAAAVKAPSHRQETWESALEWCESRGVITIINPKDKDGTPSYYSFQFKPGTFRFYAEKYWIIEPGYTNAMIMEAMKSYDLQKAVLDQMVMDPTITDKTWRESLFPGCVKKLGLPPKEENQGGTR